MIPKTRDVISIAVTASDEVSDSFIVNFSLGNFFKVLSHWGGASLKPAQIALKTVKGSI